MKKAKFSISEIAQPNPAPKHGEPEVILYVEDDDDNWDVAQLRLDHAYTILRAKTAEQACELVREHDRRIAAILMDIELRGSDLNGVELTELLRGKPPQRAVPAYAHELPVVTNPIVFVTAHGARYSDVELMLFGADLVISKPVNFPALKLALASLAPRAQHRR